MTSMRTRTRTKARISIRTRTCTHLQRQISLQLQQRRPVFRHSIEGRLSQQQRDRPMTQTRLQSHLDHLWADSSS